MSGRDTRFFSPCGGGMWDNAESGTGRCANTDPLLDRINLVQEGSGPMAIMPEAQSTVSTSPTLLAERMSRADACPSCCTNVETPSGVYSDGEGAFIANYVCLSCGHAWTTGWRD